MSRRSPSNGVRLVSSILLVALALACDDSAPAPPSLGSVAPLYPSNGADWNDYVKNDGADVFEASDTAATGAEPGDHTALLHGGEMRVVEVSSRSDCAGLSAADDLGAFDWVCDDRTGAVRFISTGLAEGAYLSDLIDFSAGKWRANAVTGYEGGRSFGATARTVWHGNPIVIDNDGGSLAAGGTVYIVDRSIVLATNYTLDADRVSLVVEPGETVVGAGFSGSVVLAKGTFANPALFQWVEGSFDGTGDTTGVELNIVRHSVLRGLSARNADANGVLAWYVDNSLISDIDVDGNAQVGLSMRFVTGNRVKRIAAYSNGATIGGGVQVGDCADSFFGDIRVTNNSGEGFTLLDSTGNVIHNVNATNNGNLGQLTNEGIIVFRSTNNVLANLLAANNEDIGISVSVAADSNVLLNLTSTNNGRPGLRLVTSSRNTVMNLAAVNNFNSPGLDLFSSSENTLANVAVANQANYHGIQFHESQPNSFTGLLKVGSNDQDCVAPTTAGSGLMTATGIGPCIIDATLSDALLVEGVTAAASFVGKVTSDDTVNSSDTNGAALYDDIQDWIGFENEFRGWGVDGLAFPGETNHGRSASGIDSRIWDWSLAASGDTGDAGGPVLLDELPVPSGDDVLTHTWSGAAGSTTFLRNAVEILEDDIGNDDLLCESGEDCIHTPNIGAYQGHGPLVSIGPITDGIVSGVTLWRYETNGR
jgi:parallel beta-helix repeat protein